MTTSGIADWSLTANEVINSALGDELGVIGLGEQADADDASFALYHLNALLKGLADNAHLETIGTVTIPANDASGILSADVQDVVSARILTTYERPLARFERDEYLSLPNKTASGEPTCFYVSRQRDAVTMYVWPVPTVETTIRIDYHRRIEVVTDIAETLDLPEEYLPALVANLAARCAGRFRISPNEMPELFNRAQTLMRELQDGQRPASYMLGAY